MAKLNNTSIEGDLNVEGVVHIGGGSRGASFPGVRYPIDQYVSSDKSTGYVKYNDGYKEVWGTVKRDDGVTYPNSFAFTTLTYNIQFTFASSTDISSSDTPLKVVEKTTTRCKWQSYHTYDNTAYYYCRGY